MSKEGYLIRHGNTASEIIYCVLGDGKVSFYKERDGEFMSEIGLSRTKLKIRGVLEREAHSCSHSFLVSLRPSRLVNGRQHLVGPAEEFLLTAPSNKEKKEWGNAIHSWQRHYWREPLHVEQNMAEEEIDAYFRDQYAILTQMLQASPRGKLKTKPALLRKSTSSADSMKHMAIGISLPSPSLKLTYTYQQSAY